MTQSVLCRAKAANILILNELGLDPGIDHLTAKKIIDEAHADKSRIYKFISWCGGLPAPENSNNPFGYKFSWSPRGVLLAALNGASYRWNGVMETVEEGKLMSASRDVDLFKGFALEGVPNRDSLSYVDLYGLDKTTNNGEVETMFRGTLRFKGFCSLLRGCMSLGLANKAPRELKNVHWVSDHF